MKYAPFKLLATDRLCPDILPAPVIVNVPLDCCMQFDAPVAVQFITGEVTPAKVGEAEVRRSCSTAATSAAARVTAPVRVLKLDTPPPAPHPVQLDTVRAPDELIPYAPQPNVIPLASATD